MTPRRILASYAGLTAVVGAGLILLSALLDWLGASAVVLAATALGGVASVAVSAWLAVSGYVDG